MSDVPSYYTDAQGYFEPRWYQARSPFWALLFIALFFLIVFGGF